MSKGTKKAAILVLALCMILGTVACNATQVPTAAPTAAVEAIPTPVPTSTPAPQKEAVTITWLGAISSNNLTTGIIHNPVLDEIAKRTGVTIDHTPSLGVSDVDQQISIFLASGDLPDVCTSTGSTIVPKVLTAKAAIPLDDLIKTNGQDLLKNSYNMLAVSKLTNSDDSHALYILHNNAGDDGKGDIFGRDNDWIVRWDLYKQLGMPKINNYDDLLKLGSDMMKLEPTNKDGKKNYAFSGWFGDTWGYLICTKPADNYSGIKSYHVSMGFDVKNDAVVPYITDPNVEFWAEAKMLNKAFQQGLLDPTSATMKWPDFLDQAKTGRFLIGMCNWEMNGADGVFQADGHPEKGYMPILVGTPQPSGFFTEASLDGGQYSTFISKNCKNPDRVMDLLNFLSTSEGLELTMYGIEGTHWTAGSDYLAVNPDVIAAQKQDADYNKKQGINQLWFIMPVGPRAVKDPRGFIIAEDPKVAIANAPQYVKDFCTDMKVDYPAQVIMNTTDHYCYWNSMASVISLPGGSDLAANSAQIDAYVPTAMAQAIFQPDEAGFDAKKAEIIQKCKDLGADAILAYYAQQYKDQQAVLATMK